LRSIARGATAKVFAAALLISPIPLVATTVQAPAQVSFSVNFRYFYDSLAPYGSWHYHPRWGDVWRPSRVEIDFRPYQRGHWQYTFQFGWVWLSDYIWGDIAFHYGRWVYDPFDGWLWVPGYVWAPAWVIWRSGGGYVGWFPMPPDDGFLYGQEAYLNRWDNWGRGYGYLDWYGPGVSISLLLSFWTFVDDRHFADRDFVRYVPPRSVFPQIVNTTTNVTNYVTVNNYIVNRSVDVARIERAAGRRIAAVEAREVIRRGTPMMTVDVGRRVEQNERAQHGGDRNASPLERLSVLPESRARAISPPLGAGRTDRDRIERVVPTPGAPRERPGAVAPSDQQRERAIERRTAPSAPPAARQQERAPRAQQSGTELRQGPLGQPPAQGAPDRRIDRRQQSDRDQKAARGDADSNVARGK
jgi:hypothetical protein